jgi:hypothetical protein
MEELTDKVANLMVKVMVAFTKCNQGSDEMIARRVPVIEWLENRQ